MDARVGQIKARLDGLQYSYLGLTAAAAEAIRWM